MGYNSRGNFLFELSSTRKRFLHSDFWSETMEQIEYGHEGKFKNNPS